MKAEWEKKETIRRYHFQTTGLPQDKERREREKIPDNFQKLSRKSPKCIKAINRYINQNIKTKTGRERKF